LLIQRLSPEIKHFFYRVASRSINYAVLFHSRHTPRRHMPGRWRR